MVLPSYSPPESALERCRRRQRVRRFRDAALALLVREIGRGSVRPASRRWRRPGTRPPRRSSRPWSMADSTTGRTTSGLFVVGKGGAANSPCSTPSRANRPGWRPRDRCSRRSRSTTSCGASSARRNRPGSTLTHADRASTARSRRRPVQVRGPRPSSRACGRARRAKPTPRCGPPWSLRLPSVDIGPDSSPPVRIAAAERLGASESPEARAILGLIVGDAEANAAVRDAARAALQQIGDRLELYRQFGAERVPGHQPRLGAAAGGHRPGDHIRRHGRDQHGAWRDGDGRRLRHLRGAGAVPHLPRRNSSASRSLLRCRRPSSPDWRGSASSWNGPSCRWLYGRPLETLLATWGVSLVILQQAVRTIFGSTNREVGSPEWMSGAIELAGGVAITYNRVWIILFSLRRGGRGCWRSSATPPSACEMRAVTQNRPMAERHGHPVGQGGLR